MFFCCVLNANEQTGRAKCTQDSLVEKEKKKILNRQITLKYRITKNEFIVNMLQAINITLLLSSSGSFECLFSSHEFGACENILHFHIMQWNRWKNDDLYPWAWAFYSKHSLLNLMSAANGSIFYYSSIRFKIKKKEKKWQQNDKWKRFSFSSFIFSDSCLHSKYIGWTVKQNFSLKWNSNVFNFHQTYKLQSIVIALFDFRVVELSLDLTTETKHIMSTDEKKEKTTMTQDLCKSNGLDGWTYAFWFTFHLAMKIYIAVLCIQPDKLWTTRILIESSFGLARQYSRFSCHTSALK